MISKNTTNIKINSDINSKEIRLLDNNGQMLGIVNIEEGLRIAQEKKLDLIEISPNASPPVCKILDFGKYKYEIRKKEHEAKKKQKTIEIKEVKLRPNIAIGDFNVKLNNTKKFINSGNKVKITLFFKGREIMHEDVGINIMKKFKDLVLDFSNIESDIKKEGKRIFIIIAPKKK
ncbi:translation initiation factor IF-3 [Rickettsiales endosymbiont of Trichoplax sp. H2]|uniref:translation initiation factor IF-3 n=1 Tax=Rickettsiales endosymbiont of Trichoplax sp. H2 TaxID=2021221 RepID=UPI002DDCFD57|nr:translation initiation factor IF-3 [Rickettsiales endosymbiont of Trichoplax sp. H2]